MLLFIFTTFARLMQSAVCGAGVYTERQSFSRLYSIVRIVAQATVYIYIYKGGGK
jgi:hypothetical protein